MLFGVFAVHTAESCPLNNDVAKRKVKKRTVRSSVNVKLYLDVLYANVVKI